MVRMAKPRAATVTSRFTNFKHPTAFSSASAVTRSLKSEGLNTDFSTVSRTLSRLPAYVQHKRVVRRFPRRRTFSYYLDYIWQADLLPVEKWSNSNDGICFLLTVKDIFSKFTWVKPLLNKESKSVAAGLRSIFTEFNRTPTVLLTDAGNEFRGQVITLLKQRNIRKVESLSDVKCSAVENYNRTLKKRITTYQTWADTQRYINVLPQIVAAINNTKHISTGITPVSVTFQNQPELYYRKYHNKTNLNSSPKHKFNVGDLVLVAYPQRVFRRGYEQQFGPEHFFISEVRKTQPVTYKIKDYNNNVLQKVFYEPQLTAFTYKHGQTEDIEVLDKRNNDTELLIHFLSAPKTNTEWVRASKVKRYNVIENGV